MLVGDVMKNRLLSKISAVTILFFFLFNANISSVVSATVAQ